MKRGAHQTPKEARDGIREQRYAPLSVMAATVAFGCHAAAFALYFSSRPLHHGIDEAGLQVVVMLIASQSISVAGYCTTRRHFFRLLTVLRVATILGLGYRFRDLFDVRTAMLLGLVVEIGVYEGYATNLLIQGFVIALTSTVFDLVGGTWYMSTSYRIESICSTGLVIVSSIVASLCTLFHERLLSVQRNETRLLQAVEALSETNTHLQDHAFEVEAATRRDEQKRIAQQIHDSVGYTLTSLVMMMEAAADMVITRPVEVEQLIETARDEASKCLDETRDAVYALRAQPSGRVTLTQAVHRLSRTFEKVTGTSVTANFGNAPNSFGDRIDTALYRIIREGLTNAFRHGKANRIEIYFWVGRDGMLDLRIDDNGVGASELNEGMGFAGIRERLKEVHGTVRTETLQNGFELQVLLPVRGDGCGKISCDAG